MKRTDEATAARIAEIEAWAVRAEIAIRDLLADQRRPFGHAIDKKNARIDELEHRIVRALARIRQVPAYLLPEGVVEALAILQGDADE